MSLILFLLLGLIILVLVSLVILPYIRIKSINKKYPTSSKIMFAPAIGSIYHQLQLQAKNEDPLKVYCIQRNPQQKFLITNILSRPYIMLEDETLAKQFLLNHHNFTKYSNFLFGEYYFSKNIVSQNGEQWQRQKKIMSKAINFDFIKKIVPNIQQIAQSKINQIKANQPLNSQNLIFEHNSQSISMSFFSENLAKIQIKDKNLVSQLTRLINYCIERSTQLYSLLRLNIIPISSINWGFLLTKKQKQTLEQFKTVKKIIQLKVQQRIQNMKKESGKQYGDFLSYYLELYNDPNNKNIQMQQILQQFDSLLVAGSDTGAILGQMCIYCLAKYPQWYQKLQQLINQLPEKLALEDVNKHEQLTYFIKQVSRFYPPAPFVFPRYNQKSVKIGEFQFPAGCFFTPSAKVIMNNPQVFQNPDKFNPQRWDKLSGRVWSYLTFSGGPRSCLGQKLAMVNLKILLIQFIKKYSVQLNPDVELVMGIKTLYKPKNNNLIIPILKTRKK